MAAPSPPGLPAELRWLETAPREPAPVSLRLTLARKAVEARPDSATTHAMLAHALLRTGDYAAAALAFEAGLAADPAGFRDWAMFARTCLKLDRPADALRITDLGLDRGEDARNSFQRAQALRALGRFDEARAEYRRTIAWGDPGLLALKALLGEMAIDPDGAPMLEFCDSLDPVFRNTALIRAHRALAFSRLGRVEEALEIVDLERHPARVRFDPPHGFGGIDKFNARLAGEILQDPEPDPSELDGFEITYLPPTRDRPAMQALLAFMRDSIETYIAELPSRGLATVMQPVPEAGTLYSASLVLRDDGANGEHIHAMGFVSTVYHVRVPALVTQANDDRGALIFGICENYTRGYQPCWGTRAIRPVAGWLTLFPSHLFHDVVPTRLSEPRISVSSDIWPVGVPA